MKSLISVVGIILIIIGIFGFSYKYFTYTSNERVAQIGNVEITANQEKAVFISPVLSGLSLGVGIILVIAGISRRK